MSWDILLINSLHKPNLESDDPELPVFPPRKEIIQIFTKTFPNMEFSEDGWGSVDNKNYSIEVNLEDDSDEEQNQIMLYIRGSDDPAPYIAQLCKSAGWQAYDTTMGDYIDLDNPSKNGFSGWQSYRGQVIGNHQKPWWKFW